MNLARLVAPRTRPSVPDEYTFAVSDHRGSNSQVVDFERVEIYPIFTIKTENPEKSNT
jgi:hypothetical protein